MKAKLLSVLFLAVISFQSYESENKSIPPDSLNIFDFPRYKENPINLYFEFYIQDVLGMLPKERNKIIQEMNVGKILKTKSNVWQKAIRESLHLSNTIDIAIWDLWCINKEKYKLTDSTDDIILFSQNLTDEYFKDGSKIDVWPPGALEAAKIRIKNCRNPK